MTTQAVIGYGAAYAIYDTSVSPDAYTTLGEVTNIDLGSDDVDQIDATHMSSPNRRREYIPGLIDGGEMTVEMNFVPSSATDVLIRGHMEAGTVANHRVRFPTYSGGTAQQIIVAASIVSYSRGAPLDDKMVGSITVKKSSSETQGNVTG
jgi:hypothetical protein